MSKTLYVGNLPFTAEQEDVRDLFDCAAGDDGAETAHHMGTLKLCDARRVERHGRRVVSTTDHGTTQRVATRPPLIECKALGGRRTRKGRKQKASGKKKVQSRFMFRFP